MCARSSRSVASLLNGLSADTRCDCCVLQMMWWIRDKLKLFAADGAIPVFSEAGDSKSMWLSWATTTGVIHDLETWQNRERR